MANRHMKEIQHYYSPGKCKIKPNMRYYYESTRMAKNESLIITGDNNNMEQEKVIQADESIN